MATEAPTNIQDPVFSRWGTVLAAVELFVDKWVVIYFFALALKGDQKSGCYLWQLSCALLSLMNNKSEPTMDGGSLDNFIGSFSEENEGDSCEKLKPGETPIFLAVLFFLDGFSKVYYQDMFKFLMKNDPVLGINTFGQMARFGPERCYVMHQKLSNQFQKY